MSKPLIVFLCEGGNAHGLASEIRLAAQRAGLDAIAEAISGKAKDRAAPSVTVWQKSARAPVLPNRTEPGEMPFQPQQQQQQLISDVFEVIVSGAVDVAAFAVFAKNCLDIFAKTKEILKPPKLIEVTLDGRKVEVRSGDDIRDVLRRYDETT